MKYRFIYSFYGFRYIYTDQITLTTANVVHILYASKKYIITNLSKRCTQFLEEHMTTEDLPQLLDQSLLFDETELKNKVLAKVKDDASAVLASDEFLNLSTKALEEVLSLELKITRELEVYQGVLKWAKAKCDQLKRSPEGTNLREVMGNSLFLIRFPTMTTKEFSESVASQDILTASEGYDIFRFMSSESNKPKLPFPTEPRFKPTHKAGGKSTYMMYKGIASVMISNVLPL